MTADTPSVSCRTGRPNGADQRGSAARHLLQRTSTGPVGRPGSSVQPLLGAHELSGNLPSCGHGTIAGFRPGAGPGGDVWIRT
ncbi:hypothetical protein EDD99_5420 [Streptomyces sp. 846.5]|nr:hypothetical protein EDD99_5420 [Streptomyces sp. 846.5]